MPIPANQVQVGQCYETANNQQRRVVAIDGDDVIYESWGGNVMNTKPPLHRTTVNIKKFAKDVDKQIPCPSSLPPMPTMP